MTIHGKMDVTRFLELKTPSGGLPSAGCPGRSSIEQPVVVDVLHADRHTVLDPAPLCPARSRTWVEMIFARVPPGMEPVPVLLVPTTTR